MEVIRCHLKSLFQHSFRLSVTELSVMPLIRVLITFVFACHSHYALLFHLGAAKTAQSDAQPVNVMKKLVKTTDRMLSST